MKGLIICCLCALAIQVKAQQLSIGYSGTYITHPGLQFAYSKSIREAQNPKEKLNQKEIHLGFVGGGYFHKNMHSAAYLMPQLSLKKVRQSGRITAYDLGLGLHRTAISGTYERVGDVYEKTNFSGSTEFVFSPAFTWGHTVESDLIDSWYLTNRLMFFPFYTEQGTFRYFLEIGIAKKIKHKK